MLRYFFFYVIINNRIGLVELMINISGTLASKFNKVLNKSDDNTVFSDFELSSIKRISLSHNDLEYIDYLYNIEVLELDSFPSVTNEDLEIIASKLNRLKGLKIKEQNALLDVDLTPLQYLEELCLIHNDNLVNVHGLDKIRRFTFYDNKDFEDIKQIVDFLLNNQNSTITLDVSYYINIVNILFERKIDIKLLNRFTWVESAGLRKYYTYEYTNAELESMLKIISTVVSKYVYATDGDIEKFGVLYNWMINNIKFVNEDDPKLENINLVSNVNKVFNFGKGGRLSYAKAFQMLLSFVGIKSSVVYSLGAIDDIGTYNGEKIYSLLGESDYAVLRVTLDDRDYYCDVAWDALILEHGYYDRLRLFLFSKNELKLRHKFVGEANITNTHSYRGDDSDDLIMFANDRIREVNEIFDDIERLKPEIDGIGLNIAISKSRVREIKSELDNLEIMSEDYKNKVNELDKLEDQIDLDEAELIRLENSRKNIVVNYSRILVGRYLECYKDLNFEELMYVLEKKEEIKLLSSYMYKILKLCVKEAA